MTPDWEIFSAALEHNSPAERTAFLDAACSGRPETRSRIEALLRATESAGRFLSEPEPPAAPGGQGTGACIGPYRLLHRLGEGGFGVVYLAEQDEPIRRRVALKIIKLGMDTRAVIARFEAERQALALMEHPHIARALDAGATSAGRPYFVMEFVPGVPITIFGRERRLRLRARLELFLQVCRAVHHAHQKGVIHRDLKPSNILVSDAEGAPTAKVIDFGIAKATQEPLTEKTLHTWRLGFVGTPDYVSPEQVGFGNRDVDTRADIYSLGVLLYELLTERTPLDARKRLVQGYAAVERAILHGDPPPPSQRVAALDRRDREELAGFRQTTPAGLIRSLRGDLDRIVLKCLEKDRTRRYETTNALALDLARYLNDEAVHARPATLAYRTIKFVRRHVRAVATTGALALLLAGIGTYHARRLAAERDRARIEAAKAERVTDLLTEMLTGSDPFRTGGREPSIEKLLEEGATLARKELADQPEVRARILTVVGRTLLHLGRHAKAEALLAEALAAGRTVGRADLRIAETLAEFGVLLRERGDYRASVKALEQALAQRRELLPRLHVDVWTSLVQLGRGFSLLDELARAEPLFREAMAIQGKMYGPDDQETAAGAGDYGLFLWCKGEFARAEPLLRQSYALTHKLLGAEHANSAQTAADLALLLAETNDLAGAETMLQGAVRTYRQTMGERHWRVARTLGELGSVELRLGRAADAARTLDEALSLVRAELGEDHPLAALLLVERARTHLVLAEPARAEALLRQALAIQQRIYAETGWRVAATRGLLGQALLLRLQHEEAETLLRKAVAGLKDVPGQQRRDWDSTRTALAALYEVSGRGGQAAP